MVRMSDLIRAGSGAAPPTPPANPEVVERREPAPRAEAPPATTSEPPGPPAPSRTEPAPSEATTPAAEQLFTELEAFLEDVGRLVKSGRTVSWPELEQLVDAVVGSLEGSGELFWVANRPAAPPGADYLAFHQARVAVLAARVAANIGYDRPSCLGVALAGCLIDVGLWQLPASVLQRLDALSPEELSQYRAHPRLSADIVRRWAPPYDGVVQMILQHHEREQGQGFPQGASGAAIRDEAKLLGLVDTYTGLTAPPSLRPGLRPHEAIREIVRSKNESFPPPLIKALLGEISVFPPGTLVRLNSGESGRVVAINRNHPLRPRLEVYDTKGRPPAAPKLIDLSETPFLYITGAVSETA